MSIKASRYFQPARSFKKTAMSESEDRPYLQIIGGLVVGATVLALVGHYYMGSKPKRKCREVIKGETSPRCIHISPGKRRFTATKDEDTVQQVSHAIPPSVSAATMPEHLCAAPAIEQPCVTPVKDLRPIVPPSMPVAAAPVAEGILHSIPPSAIEPCVTPTKKGNTPRAHCEERLTAGGEARKPWRKTSCKKIEKPNEDVLPWGCGERVKKVEPSPKPCSETEAPIEKIVRKKQCGRNKCVGIDPSKRRWPLLRAPDDKYSPQCKCEPIDQSKRRF